MRTNCLLLPVNTGIDRRYPVERILAYASELSVNCWRPRASSLTLRPPQRRAGRDLHAVHCVHRDTLPNPRTGKQKRSETIDVFRPRSLIHRSGALAQAFRDGTREIRVLLRGLVGSPAGISRCGRVGSDSAQREDIRDHCGCWYERRLQPRGSALDGRRGMWGRTRLRATRGPSTSSGRRRGGYGCALDGRMVLFVCVCIFRRTVDKSCSSFLSRVLAEPWVTAGAGRLTHLHCPGHASLPRPRPPAAVGVPGEGPGGVLRRCAACW